MGRKNVVKSKLYGRWCGRIGRPRVNIMTADVLYGPASSMEVSNGLWESMDVEQVRVMAFVGEQDRGSR